MSFSILQFSIVFWSFLSAFAAWLDNFLLDSLLDFGDDERTVIGYVMPGVVHNPDATAIRWVVRMCYYLLPLLFTIFFGAVGQRTGQAISAAFVNFGGGEAKSGASMANRLLK